MGRDRFGGRVAGAGSRATSALVLAGGGSLGAIEVGMLKALVPHGLHADFVVGTSVGAINGAYFAGSPDWEGVRGLERLWRRLERERVFSFSPLDSLRGLVSHRDYLVDPGSLRHLLETCLPFQRLEETAAPCHVLATDVLDGSAVVLSSGPAVDALMASASVPPIFPPVRLEDQFLVEGGLASRTPISVAVDLGATRVYVLTTGFGCSIKAPPHGAVALALQALTLVIDRQLSLDIERYKDVVELVIPPPLCPVNVSPYDFSHTGELIDRAEASTLEWLAERELVHACSATIPRSLTYRRSAAESALGSASAT